MSTFDAAMYQLLFTVWTSLVLPSDNVQLSKRGHLLHYCLDSKYHKTEPGPEDSLHGQCEPWKNRSCCMHNTTVRAHLGINYNFNFNHCPGKPLSTECNRYFIQDSCFYECSPNIGPWVVKVEMKTRKERFYKVPLCESECLAWFKSCEYDYTCTDNWIKGFVWRNKTNHCRRDKTCRTFKETFGTAKTFCENVWDSSWEVIDGGKPCMKLWFDGLRGNPNDAVAKWKAESSDSQFKFNLSFEGLLSLIKTAISLFHWLLE